MRTRTFAILLCFLISAACALNEENHEAAFDAIRDYVDAHWQKRAQAANAANSDAHDNKYLIFRDPGCVDVVGFGNRFQGFISAMILAWVTGRVFLLDERLQDGSMLDDPAINWDYSTYDTQNDIEPWIPREQHVITQPVRFDTRLGSVLYITNRDPNSEKVSMDWFLCADFENAAEKHIIIYASYSFAHLLTANPHVGDKLISTFGAKPFYFFAQRFLSSPHPRIAARVDAVWQQVKSMGCTHTIGVHIRRERFVQFLDDDGQDMMFRCARWLSLEYGADDVNTCVFLASDTASTRDLAVATLAPLRVFGLQDAEVAPDAATPASKDNAVIEWFLLRKCDELVVTLGSSFGTTAAGAEGIKPVGVTTVHGPGYTGPSCVRQITPFTFGNPIHWTDRNAYRPNKRFFHASCQINGELEARREELVGEGKHHSPFWFPFRVDPNVEGISLPPQRGNQPEGLGHTLGTCYFDLLLRENSWQGKLGFVLGWLAPGVVLTLAVFACIFRQSIALWINGGGLTRMKNCTCLKRLREGRDRAHASPRRDDSFADL